MKKEKVPDTLDPVLAEITALSDGGWFSTWYEVVYYDANNSTWHSYSNSETFDCVGDKVLNWKYCSEALNE